MADPKAKDVQRGMPHQREPSPNEVAGYYGNVDPDDLTEEQLKNWSPRDIDPDDWHPPVDPTALDRDSHVTIVPQEERNEANIVAVPTADAASAWDALAYTSQHPALASQQMTAEEQERLRAETFAPSGSEPVGQEKVVGRSDPVPYTPPLPVIEGTTVDLTPEEPEDDPRDVQIEPAPCGNPECFVFVGEEGRQEIHVEQCPGASS